MAVALNWVIKYVSKYGEVPSDLNVTASYQKWTEKELPELVGPKGVTFLGWYTEEGSKANIGDSIYETFDTGLGSSTVVMNLQLYAKWSITYSILDNTLKRMAEAVRKLSGEIKTMFPSEMAARIEIPYSRTLITSDEYVSKYLIQMGYNENVDRDSAGHGAPTPVEEV